MISTRWRISTSFKNNIINHLFTDVHISQSPRHLFTPQYPWCLRIPARQRAELGPNSTNICRSAVSGSSVWSFVTLRRLPNQCDLWTTLASRTISSLHPPPLPSTVPALLLLPSGIRVPALPSSPSPRSGTSDPTPRIDLTSHIAYLSTHFHIHIRRILLVQSHRMHTWA